MRISVLSHPRDEPRPFLSQDFGVTTERGATLFAIRRRQIILVLSAEVEVGAFRKKVLQGDVKYDHRQKTVLYWNGVNILFTKPEYEALRRFVREELE